MIQLIVGEKGKGKTKVLLEKLGEAAASAKGNVVFIDKDMSHIYEVKNSVRLINCSEYGITNPDEFNGFVSGIMSADHDLEDLFIDRFLLVSYQKDKDEVADSLRKIEELSNKSDVKITVSLSLSKEQLPADLQEKVLVAL
ncbi:hypothetical protein SAMN06296386_104154 [Lachnospiraceae bacterium]|nr:hypothetical protein SAMN06296386_104154 [Lachnospiraceae bacterium]